jgi:hypothetical protein
MAFAGASGTPGGPGATPTGSGTIADVSCGHTGDDGVHERLDILFLFSMPLLINHRGAQVMDKLDFQGVSEGNARVAAGGRARCVCDSEGWWQAVLVCCSRPPVVGDDGAFSRPAAGNATHSEPARGDAIQRLHL